MPCSRKETLTRLFLNITSILKFFFLFFYLFALFFSKVFTYVFRSGNEYDEGLLYDEEEEEESSRYSHDESNNYLHVDIVNNGESLVFMSEKMHETENNKLEDEQSSGSSESIFEDPIENLDDATFYVEDCTTSSSDFEHDNCDDFAENEVIKEVYTTNSSSNLVELRFEPKKDVQDDNDTDGLCQSSRWLGQSDYAEEIIHQTPTLTIGFNEFGSEMNLEDYTGGKDERTNEIVEDTKFSRDGKFLIFDPPKSEMKKLQVMEKEKYATFEDTYTIGSTSKSSSDWRSSIPDSCTEDPFSSSSRRSCPKWESYTVYQKYDEEMIFLDRISAQKLHETESLRSFQEEPRSISQRIVHKLANKQKCSEQVYKKTYYQLEAAYVAQICLAWEALNWNYANFQRKRVSMKEEDHGCPAYIAQQFQQLQVLLQRFIENEPYERGRRPEIYARMRGCAPKLLQVPEYHDYEGEHNEEALNARIPSTTFLSILEEAIRTYMNFLKADRKTHCQVFTSLFKRRSKLSVDPAILHLLKSQCKKKKLKLRELQRTCILFRRRKIESDEEMEILMALIDLEVVTRVLRMTEITQQQLKWCEDKMNKVTLLDGKLQRDSSPLFFPPHLHTNNTLVVDAP